MFPGPISTRPSPWGSWRPGVSRRGGLSLTCSASVPAPCWPASSCGSCFPGTAPWHHTPGRAGLAIVRAGGLLTLFLMFVVLSVSTGSKEKGLMAGVAVGAVIALEALFAGPISGASMNPARSLAPALVCRWRPVGLPDRARCSAPSGRSWSAAASTTNPAVIRWPGSPAHDAAERRPSAILFVCVENSNRSQMAEAFARIHGGGLVEAYSAGSRPSGMVNPRAVEFMKRARLRPHRHHSKGLTDLPPGRVRRGRRHGLRRRGLPAGAGPAARGMGHPRPEEPAAGASTAWSATGSRRKVKELLADLS